MSLTEFITSSENSMTHVFIDGEWRGSFSSARKAQKFVSDLTNRDIVLNVTSPLVVGQKNDEVKRKRRGRRKKADNDGSKLPIIRLAGA